jgi:WD40 repeat protein
MLQVKICKFLHPFPIIATADLYGYIYFWGVMPSAAKNELLCSIKDDIESEVGTIENFPIRAMDFDGKNTLYTGDEMGNMHKCDLSNLIRKLQEFDRHQEANKHSSYGVREFKKTLNQFEKMHNFDAPTEQKAKHEEDKSNTFLTKADVEEEEKEEKDVFLVQRWKAHTDGITWVTFNEDPSFIATSSFDKNVYIWNEN